MTVLEVCFNGARSKFGKFRPVCQKTGQKGSVFRHFSKNFDRKKAFFGARSPLKYSHIGAEDAFRTILRFLAYNGCHKVIPNGEHFGKIWQPKLREEGQSPPPSARHWFRPCSQYVATPARPSFDLLTGLCARPKPLSRLFFFG